MKYVYPKFSKHEIPGVRFAGAGLGNLLFIYSRALVAAKNNNWKVIWPTWFSLRIGSWIRNESDKRTYHDLFKPTKSDIKGVRKYLLLAFNRKAVNYFDYDNSMMMSFDDLKGHEAWLSEQFELRLKKKNKGYMTHDFSNQINVHVRLGDFSPPSDADLDKGYNSIATSIDWFVGIIKELNKILEGKVIFNIFSDGSDEELSLILALPNVRRLSFGTSIADMMALSKTKLIIASGSSFSLWARFLGHQSCIAYYKQLKSHIIMGNLDDGFEIEIGKEILISDDVIGKIRSLYKH